MRANSVSAFPGEYSIYCVIKRGVNNIVGEMGIYKKRSTNHNKERLDNEIADITKIINVSVICLCKIKEKGIIHM